MEGPACQDRAKETDVATPYPSMPFGQYKNKLN